MTEARFSRSLTGPWPLEDIEAAIKADCPEFHGVALCHPQTAELVRRIKDMQYRAERTAHGLARRRFPHRRDPGFMIGGSRETTALRVAYEELLAVEMAKREPVIAGLLRQIRGRLDHLAAPLRRAEKQKAKAAALPVAQADVAPPETQPQTAAQCPASPPTALRRAPAPTARATRATAAPRRDYRFRIRSGANWWPRSRTNRKASGMRCWSGSAQPRPQAAGRAFVALRPSCSGFRWAKTPAALCEGRHLDRYSSQERTARL